MSNDITTMQTSNILSDFTAFENAQRIGKMLMQSGIIPKDYQNNLPNVMVALEISNRNKLSPIVVMQNLNIINGRPFWSSKFVIAALTSSKVTNLHYDFIEDGFIETSIGFNNQKKKIANLKCRVIATDKKTGEERIGPWISMQMAIAEGWYGKNGSKWQTMPEVMIRYRAATFFASAYYPELYVGIESIDDIPDTTDVQESSKEVITTVGEITPPIKETVQINKNKTIKKNEEQKIDRDIPKLTLSEKDTDEWSKFDD